MTRLMIGLAGLLALACGESRAPREAPTPATPEAPMPATPEAGVSVAPMPLPALAPDRLAFWHMWIGEVPGQQGPSTSEWCRTAKDAHRREIVRGVKLFKSEDTCSLLAYGETDEQWRLLQEIEILMQRWDRLAGNARNARVWVDAPNRLHAIRPDPEAAKRGSQIMYALHWQPYRPLEEIIGTTRLLADIDVEALHNAPVADMKRAAVPPYRISSCDPSSCALEGPGGPGGDRTIVFSFIRDGKLFAIGVSIATSFGHRTPALQRIIRALGPPTRTHDDELVWERSPNRHVHVREAPDGIWIDLLDPQNRFRR